MKYIFLCMVFFGINVGALAQDNKPTDMRPHNKTEHGVEVRLEQNFEMFQVGAEYKSGTYLGNIAFIKPPYNDNWMLEISTQPNYAWPYLRRGTFTSLSEEEFLTLLKALLDTANAKNLSMDRVGLELRLIQPLWAEILASIHQVAQTKTGTIGMKEIELRSDFDQVFATSPVIKSACDLFVRKGYKCERVSSSHGFRRQYIGKPWTAILNDHDLGIRSSSKLHFILVPN